MQGLQTVFMNFQVPKDQVDDIGIRWAVEQLLTDALCGVAAAHELPQDALSSVPAGVDAADHDSDHHRVARRWRIDFILSVVHEYDIVFIELCTADEMLAEAFGSIVDAVTERMLSMGRLSPLSFLKPTERGSEAAVVRMGYMVPYRVECDGVGATLECLLDGEWQLKAPVAVTDVLVALGFASNGRELRADLGPPSELDARELRLLERLAVSRASDPDVELPLLIEFEASRPLEWRINEKRRSA